MLHKISLQQYRRALILAICCKNARRSQEIVKYSLEEYYRDLVKQDQSQEEGDELVLYFMQHKTAKNRKAAIAVVSGLRKEALFYYVTRIRPFVAPPEFKNVFFSNSTK